MNGAVLAFDFGIKRIGVAVGEWADSYADLTERDHAALVAQTNGPAHS